VFSSKDIRCKGIIDSYVLFLRIFLYVRYLKYYFIAWFKLEHFNLKRI